MHNVGQKLAVHFFHLGPVGAVQVWYVEIVALIAPAFVEDLFELRFRLKVHAQSIVQSTLSRLGCAIGIDEKQLWRGSVCRTTASASKSTSTAGCAIYNLSMIRTHFITSDTADESC